MNLILPGAEEGMRAAAPAARKPICLRRPVIRADVEFGNAVPSEAKGRICVNPREFNAVYKGMPHKRSLILTLNAAHPFVLFLQMHFHSLRNKSSLVDIRQHSAELNVAFAEGLVSDSERFVVEDPHFFAIRFFLDEISGLELSKVFVLFDIL